MEAKTRKKLKTFLDFKIILLFLMILSVLPAMAQAEELAITCNVQGGSRVFIVIFPETLESELVYKKTIVKGSLQVDGKFFNFTFPPAADRYEIRILINRRTGKMLWEHGNSSFGVSHQRNVHRKGHCDVRL